MFSLEKRFTSSAEALNEIIDWTSLAMGRGFGSWRLKTWKLMKPPTLSLHKVWKPDDDEDKMKTSKNVWRMPLNGNIADNSTHFIHYRLWRRLMWTLFTDNEHRLCRLFVDYLLYSNFTCTFPLNRLNRVEKHKNNIKTHEREELKTENGRN